MLYSNHTLKKEEKEMRWGKLTQFYLEENRNFVFPTSVREDEVRKGFNRNLTIGETKSGKPRINFNRNDQDLYLLLSADRIMVRDMDILDTKVIQTGIQVEDYYNKRFHVTEALLKVPEKDLVIGTERDGAVQLYYCHDKHVYETTPKQLESLCNRLGTEMPCLIEDGNICSYEFTSFFSEPREDSYSTKCSRNNLKDVLYLNPYAIMFIPEPTKELCQTAYEYFEVKSSRSDVPERYISFLMDHLDKDDGLGSLAAKALSHRYDHLTPEQQDKYFQAFSSWKEEKQCEALMENRNKNGFLNRFDTLSFNLQKAAVKYGSVFDLSFENFQKVEEYLQNLATESFSKIYNEFRTRTGSSSSPYTEEEIRKIREISFTKEQEDEFLKKNGFFIQALDHPTEEQQLLAVTSKPSAIRFLENPSEAVMQQAVRGDKKEFWQVYWDGEMDSGVSRPKPENTAFFYIKNPSEEVQLIEVGNIPETINEMENPSEAVKRRALEQMPGLILQKPFDLEKDQDLGLEANIKIAEYIPHYNEKTMNKILDLLDESNKSRANKYSFSYIINKDGIKINEYDSATQQRLVTVMPKLFREIESPTHAVQLTAVRASQDNLRFIEKQTEPIQLAILEKGYPLGLIKNPTEPILELMIEKDYSQYLNPSFNREDITDGVILSGVRGILDAQKKENLSIKEFVQYPEQMQRAFLMSGKFEIEDNGYYITSELNITADVQRMLLKQDPELDFSLIKLGAGVSAKQAIEWNSAAKELMETRTAFLDTVAYPSEITYETYSGWHTENVTEVLDLNQHIKEHGFNEELPTYPSSLERAIHERIDEFKEICAYYRFTDEELKDFQPLTRDLIKAYMETEDYAERSLNSEAAEYAAAGKPVTGSYLPKTDHQSLEKIQIAFCMNPQEVEKAFGPIQSPEDLLAAVDSLNSDGFHKRELSKEDIIWKVSEQSHLDPSHLKVDDQNIVSRTILTPDGLMDVPLGRFENGSLNKEYSMETGKREAEPEEISMELETDLSEQDSFDTQDM